MRPAAVAALTSLLPMLSYGSLLPKAAHPGPEIWSRFEPTWTGLAAHVTGAQYRGFLGHLPTDDGLQRFFMLYALPLLLTSLVLGLLATITTRESVQRRILSSIMAAMLCQTAFCFLYGVPDRSSYLLPTIALGLTALTPLASRLFDAAPHRRRALQWSLVGLGIVILSQWGPYLGLGIGRRDLLTRLDANVRRLWTAIPFERGIVLWEGDRLSEYQLLLGEKPGLRLVRPSDLGVPMSTERFVERYGFTPVFSAAAVRPPTTPGPAFLAFENQLASRLSLMTDQPVILLKPSTGEMIVVREPDGPQAVRVIEN
jgi:hypothetical protein